MYKKKKLAQWFAHPLLVLLIGLPLQTFGSESQKMDSLKNLLSKEEQPHKQIDLILRLAERNQHIDLNKSFEYARKAEEIAQTLNIDSLFIKVKFSLAAIYFQQGEHNKALTYYLFCYKAAYRSNNDRLVLHAMANIGAIYHTMGDYENAHSYYTKASELLEKNRNKYSPEAYNNKLIALYNNMGNNCNTMDDSIQGLGYYRKALGLARKNNDTNSIGFINRNIGEYYLNHQKPDSAIKYLKECYLELKKTNNLVMLSSAYFSLGKYHAMKQEYAKAIQMYRQSVDQALKSGAMGAEKEVYFELYKLNKKLNNFEEALAQLENYKMMSDSLNKSIHLRELQMIQHNVESEKREFEQQERKKRMEIYMTLGLVIFAIAILVFVLIIRLYRTRYKLLKIEHKANELEKARLDTQIDQKNKELATNVLYLTQKNVMISESINLLKGISPELSVSQQYMLRQVLQNLENSTKTGGWEEFEVLFQQTNKAFYDALNTGYPDLTLNERRLCAFIRLNLSNKDIMSITGQSLRALEMGRHRLRKKLNIQESSIQLAQFLAELEQNKEPAHQAEPMKGKKFVPIETTEVGQPLLVENESI